MILRVQYIVYKYCTCSKCFCGKTAFRIIILPVYMYSNLHVRAIVKFVKIVVRPSEIRWRERKK